VLRKFVGAGVLALVAGLAVAGCSPVKMGAAAIVGSNRISLATLDTEAGKLSAGVAKYPGVVNLSQQQITQETLSWLIRFQINEQLASRNGITVSSTQAGTALNEIITTARQQAEQSGISNASQELILVANGIPPDMYQELGRYQAIETQYLTQANGGTLPSATSSQATQLESQLTKAQCLAAKSLNIKVNPQFGRMNYTNYSVVAAADTVSRPSGAAQTASLAGLTPAC
jgi:hypothetical protein